LYFGSSATVAVLLVGIIVGLDTCSSQAVAVARELAEIAIRLSAREPPAPGTRVSVGIDGSLVSLFDASAGVRLN
jgi:hypothetical protein